MSTAPSTRASTTARTGNLSPPPMQFPLDLRFKIVAIAPQIAVRDAAGQLTHYVRQQAFKLKEAVTVFADEAQTQPRFRIAADRVIDFSAHYHIEDAAGRPIGTVRRRGMRSIWRAHYEVLRDGQPILEIREANPWTKLADGIFGELPVVGLLSGYVFHPAYDVTRLADGALVMRAVKQPAFLEGRYRIEGNPERLGDVQDLAVLSVLMMVLLERRRG